MSTTYITPWSFRPIVISIDNTLGFQLTFTILHLELGRFEGDLLSLWITKNRFVIGIFFFHIDITVPWT